MDNKKNNIGFIRLVFASLVIIGHAPEQLDGNREREPLTMLFHTMSLGELSVDGFFLLSGFLITHSMVNSRSFGRYLERRVLRIYPAFILAFMLTVFVLGPLVGARPWSQSGQTIYHLVTLQPPPQYPGQLPGLAHYPQLNGPLWTIQYEFRCYLLVGLLGILGLLRRRWLMLCLTVLAVGADVLTTFPWVSDGIDAFHQQAAALIGERMMGLLAGFSLEETIRFSSIFLIGSCFYLFRGEISPRLTSRLALVCGLLTAALMYRPHFAETGLTTVGAFSLFWLAFKASLGPLQKINYSWDISYGVYLYGWPVATYLRWEYPAVSAWMLAILTLLIAIVCGALSWFTLEKWAKDLRVA